MKIGSISSFHLRYTDTNDFSNQRQTVLVRVETTDGIVGWGEGIAMWPEACKAVRTLTVSVAPSTSMGAVTTERMLASASSGPSSSTVAGFATLPTISYPCAGFPAVCTSTGTDRPRWSTSTAVVTREGRMATSGIG